MDRRAFTRLGAGFLGGASALLGGAAKAAGKATDQSAGRAAKHRVAIQVSTDDHRVQATALGNARNYAAYYQARNEPFAIAIVAFGPGYAMMRADLSTVKVEIAALAADLGPAVAFYGCQNSRRAAAKADGKSPSDIPQLPAVQDTPSGIVRVAELQEDGWSYVRP